MRILGIDPGLRDTGFGLVTLDGGRLVTEGYGVIQTKTGEDHQVRLAELANDLTSLCEKFKPDALALERVIVKGMHANGREVLHAIGVVMLVAQWFRLPAREYSASTVKLQVAGSGKAGKLDVQRAVQRVLGLDGLPEPDHASDALAIALTHYETTRRVG